MIRIFPNTSVFESADQKVGLTGHLRHWKKLPIVPYSCRPELFCGLVGL
jgi:hypothetical protein